jgi:hypothetical protein
MRRSLLLAIGLASIASVALAQINCGAGGSLCTTTKYGLGNVPGYRLDRVPIEDNQFAYTAADFGTAFGPNAASYFYGRTSGIIGDDDCGPERNFAPLPGQIYLRELTSCTPSTTGPTCAGGANAGQPCHLLEPSGAVAGYVNQFTPIECPGSSCQDNGGGCRVEIPITDGGGVPGGGITPPAEASEQAIVTLVRAFGPTGSVILNANSGNTVGGSSFGFCTGGPTPDANCVQHADCGAGGTCTFQKGNCQGGPTPGARCMRDSQCGAGGTCTLVSCDTTAANGNFRAKPSSGWRYLLSEARRTALNLPAGATYVRWDPSKVDASRRYLEGTALRNHGDDSVTCCAGSSQLCSSLVAGSPAYPLLNVRTCSTPNRFSTLEDNITADWVFQGGIGSRFASDPNFILPGQLLGVCTNNRLLACTIAAATARCTGNGTPYACCTGVGAGTCGSECGASGPCDLREPGHRTQIAPQNRDSFGDPRRLACGGSLIVLRGIPNQGCTLTPSYLIPGDPGNDCGVANFGRDRHYDGNCDGQNDFADACPFVSEWDDGKDTDGDCAGGVGGDCRGDECECGDHTGEGRVTVADLVSINSGIFAGAYRRLCDANSDLLCSVSDIVGANREIFDPDSSTCRQITSAKCGNNVVDAGEACDDGARCSGGPTPGAACDATAPNTCGVGGTCTRFGGDGCNTACRIEG